MMDVIFIFILGYLLPFYPPNNPKKLKIFKNKKMPQEKTPQDIIILHMCTKNYDNMMCSP